MLSLVLKCMLGAAAVLVIALLSRTRSFYIAGLVPLFPLLLAWSRLRATGL